MNMPQDTFEGVCVSFPVHIFMGLLARCCLAGNWCGWFALGVKCFPQCIWTTKLLLTLARPNVMNGVFQVTAVSLNAFECALEACVCVCALVVCVRLCVNTEVCPGRPSMGSISPKKTGVSHRLLTVSKATAEKSDPSQHCDLMINQGCETVHHTWSIVGVMLAGGTPCHAVGDL